MCTSMVHYTKEVSLATILSWKLVHHYGLPALLALARFLEGSPAKLMAKAGVLRRFSLISWCWITLVFLESGWEYAGREDMMRRQG